MKQTACLSNEAERFITDFNREHDVVLFGEEVEVKDYHEIAGGSCPDDVSYSYIPFTRTTFQAAGFIWYHPHGTTISGQFAKPVDALEFTQAEDGFTERTYNDDKVCAAIVANCGHISGFADSALI